MATGFAYKLSVGALGSAAPPSTDAAFFDFKPCDPAATVADLQRHVEDTLGG